MAEVLAKRILPEGFSLVKLVLRLLSTRLGTLLICGRVCLDTKWPFVHKFSDLSLKDREGILQNWSRGTLLPLRMVFVMLKVMCCYVFFSWVIFSQPLALQIFFTSSFFYIVVWHVSLEV